MRWLAAGLLVLLVLLWLWSHWGARQITHRIAPLGDFVDVDGYRLHYLLAGSGPPLLLVHGANANLRDFAASILPRLAQDHRVLAIDRPGYGHSSRPAQEEWLDPAAQARLLLTAAESLGLERPVIIGHSWAGSAVLAALLEMPERISGGVLLSGAAGHWTGTLGWTYELARVPGLREVFAHTLVYPAGQRLLPASVGKIHAPNPVPAEYIERTGVELALRPQTFLHNTRDMNRLSGYLQSLSPRYDEIRQPLLILHGEADELVPFWNHGERLLPVIPQAQVVLLPGVGHAPHHARPEAVATAIAAFARDLP